MAHIKVFPTFWWKGFSIKNDCQQGKCSSNQPSHNEIIMASAWVQIINEVRDGKLNEWNLCFQWVQYHYNNGDDTEFGYRFIWRTPENRLQPARGQARIPDSDTIYRLIEKAKRDGWFRNCEE